VFIVMLQDAGLDLDEIHGVLHAGKVEAWKAIARRRLAALDAEIERLQRAHAYLEGALLCRYDHPATDCRIMGPEIDRPLTPAWPRPSRSNRTQRQNHDAVTAGDATERTSACANIG
jgi:DNA-binding transcriptional MerR regulator